MNENTIGFKCKVSSTINKDIKNFGKQFMFDGNDETCWNSDEGNIQWIYMSYEKPIKFSSLRIQFQGGFAAQSSILEILENNSVQYSQSITFENSNSVQNIQLSECCTAQNIRLQFHKCYDTYGRIIIYHLILT